MYKADPVEARSYWWCALMGPKGDAVIGDPMEVTVMPNLTTCVFKDKRMGSFTVEPVMWSRMDTSPRGAYEIAMRIYEATDPKSAEKIKRTNYEADLWKERNTPTIDETLIQPAWSID